MLRGVAGSEGKQIAGYISALKLSPGCWEPVLGKEESRYVVALKHIPCGRVWCHLGLFFLSQMCILLVPEWGVQLTSLP